ncbi:MAG: FecR domain-containing protein [Cyanothece sp. SIO1E1]|nr:FecR domain-containing protein [Cyanothece sp. SIO1E1]
MNRKMYPKQRKNTCYWAGLGLSLLIGGITVNSLPLAAQNIKVPLSDRWVRVKSTRGQVTYQGLQVRRPAQTGDRLQAVGEGIDTADRSASVLDMDSNIGVIRTAQNTSIRVRRLSILADGARVTILGLNRGQARLQARRFTNPNSRLEIETPAGVAGVRGTDFGVTVNDAGKTAIATQEGAVEVSAQGESVMVNPGFASLVIPGEPPTPPQQLDKILAFKVRRFQRQGNRVRVRGEVNPTNSVFINGREVEVDKEGRFFALVRVAIRPAIRVVVRNPLGEERSHQLRSF